MTSRTVAVYAPTKCLGIGGIGTLGLVLVFMMAEMLRGRTGLVLAIASDRRPGELKRQENEKDDGKPAIPGEEVEVNIRAESAEQIAGFNAVIAAMESHGPKKVAYVLAKKLPKLADATDVLEQGQTALTDADVGLA